MVCVIYLFIIFYLPLFDYCHHYHTTFHHHYSLLFTFFTTLLLTLGFSFALLIQPSFISSLLPDLSALFCTFFLISFISLGPSLPSFFLIFFASTGQWFLYTMPYFPFYSILSYLLNSYSIFYYPWPHFLSYLFLLCFLPSFFCFIFFVFFFPLFLCSSLVESPAQAIGLCYIYIYIYIYIYKTWILLKNMNI